MYGYRLRFLLVLIIVTAIMGLSAYIIKNTSELVKQMPPTSTQMVRQALQQVRNAKKQTLHKANANTRKYFKQIKNGGNEKKKQQKPVKRECNH